MQKGSDVRPLVDLMLANTANLAAGSVRSKSARDPRRSLLRACLYVVPTFSGTLASLGVP